MIKIEKYIKILKDKQKQGFDSVPSDFFGLYLIATCKSNHKEIKKNFYKEIELYDYEATIFDEPIHYQKIKVEVINWYFQSDKDGNINIVVQLNPLEELPDWYTSQKYFDETYEEDFHRTYLSSIKTDEW